jgi:hypothetical protein
VDWWLEKWGRGAVVTGTEPLTREDVERLIQANEGTAEGLYLTLRNMRQVHLESAQLQGAILVRADLQTARLPRANLEGAQLQGANLSRADLEDANLQGVNLRWADLRGAGLWAANLEGANLGWADLRGADLRRADFQGANLRCVKFQGADLAAASISPGTNLEGVEWDPKYISALERRGNYEAGTAVYRRLKEWYRGAGMLTIAGEFHYREREAARKAGWQRSGRQFKTELAAAWRRFRGKAPGGAPEG